MTTTDKLTKTFSKNLNHYMALLGLSQTDLINALKEYGIKVNQASVSYWLSGKKTPRADKWDALCGILNISRSDLVSTNYFQTDNKVNASRIPVYGKVAAGIPIEAIEDIIDYEEIPEQMAKSGEYFGLKIQGNSMEPKISDSDKDYNMTYDKWVNGFTTDDRDEFTSAPIIESATVGDITATYIKADLS